MYKKYVLKCKGLEGEKAWNLEFYVYSKSTKCGFCHLAAVIGPLPTTEDSRLLTDVMSVDEVHKLRRAKCSYCNRTWESWDGQTVLQELWNKLAKCKYLQMDRVSKNNPFDSSAEPKHESLWDPEELFRRP